MKAIRFTPVTQCDGKRGYRNWRQAKDACRHSDLDIYQCPHCGHYHLGHKPKGLGRPKPPPPAIELEF